jgi:hypothetical protein
MALAAAPADPANQLAAAAAAAAWLNRNSLDDEGAVALGSVRLARAAGPDNQPAAGAAAAERLSAASNESGSTSSEEEGMGATGNAGGGQQQYLELGWLGRAMMRVWGGAAHSSEGHA